MDEDDIEEWYADEKEKATEEYVGTMERGENHEEAERAYTARINELTEKYKKLSVENIRKKEQRARFDRYKRMLMKKLTGKIEWVKMVFGKNEPNKR